MKPTEDLIHEHNAIKIMLGIMDKIAGNIRANKGFEAGDTEKIVDFLRTFADKCHHGKEENVLFPALVDAGVPNENGPVGVMLYEHTLGRKYINEIAVGTETSKKSNDTSGKLITEALTNYVTLLRNHIYKEENVLFPMADKMLNNEVQNNIFEQFEKIEEKIVGHGVHEQYHELLKQLKSKYID